MPFNWTSEPSLTIDQIHAIVSYILNLDIIRLEAGIERREPAQWDELRVWDPGDG